MQRRVVSRNAKFRIGTAYDTEAQDTHGTESIIEWTPTAFADGVGTPVIGV